MYDKYDRKNTPRFLAEEQIDTASRSKCDPPMIERIANYLMSFIQIVIELNKTKPYF